jgi:cytochrome c oxidase subunit 1
MVISFMAFLLASSFLVFVVNMVWSLAAGKQAEADPWRARTLEWQTSSPPPVENFRSPPRITGGPYDYGVEGAAPHATIALEAEA